MAVVVNGVLKKTVNMNINITANPISGNRAGQVPSAGF